MDTAGPKNVTYSYMDVDPLVAAQMPGFCSTTKGFRI